MSAALVSAQPRWMPAARECWEHAGLRCAIVASPIGGWNGYVQLPWGHPWRACGWLATPLGDGLSFGPSAEGWVGFDTGHAADAWHPDDDSPPYVPGWAVEQGWPAEVPVADALERMRALRRQLALSLGGELWTLPRLRAHVELLAELLAAAR
jgi:hypothetical protein